MPELFRRLYQLPAVVVGILTMSYANAEPATVPEQSFPSFGISTDVIGQIFGSHSIGLDVVTMPKLALAISYAYIKTRDFKFIPKKYSLKLEGYSTGVRGNWHFDNVNSDGFYLGAGAGYGKIRTYEENIPLEYRDSIVVSIVPGYSRRWPTGLQLRTGFGAFYTSTTKRIRPAPEVELAWYFN